MLIIIVAITCILILLLVVWRFHFIAKVKEVEGGYKYDVILPHSEPIELYFADISTMSMKVRFCLAVAGCKFKPHLVQLPTAGSFETKRQEYLQINPAGTVPVLVHHGHPIYESSEQVLYVANKLVSPAGPQLIPEKFDERINCMYWVEQTTLSVPELSADMEAAMSRRVGSCIPMISLPCFAAIAPSLSWKCLLEGLLVRGTKNIQIITIIFAVFGVKAFKYMPVFSRLVKLAKSYILTHLIELEEHLKVKKTKFIMGDNITIADICWAPVVERLDFAGWWDHIDSKKYANVIKYWKNMRELPEYKESIKPIGISEVFTSDTKDKIKKWKYTYQWFRSMYD